MRLDLGTDAMLLHRRLSSRSMTDYYVVLGIAEDSDEETIRSAFRALARRYHPDVGAGSSPVEFQRAREAYEALVDPARRRHYDQQLRASRTQPVVREVREVIVSAPFAEPLFGSRRGSFGFPTWVTRSSRFDDLVDELFALLADESFGPRRSR